MTRHSAREPLTSLPLPLRLALYAGLVLLAALAAGGVQALFAPGVSPGLADKDFANYWAAAHLAGAGRLDIVFGENAPYLATLRGMLGPEFPWHNWSYPPSYLLLMMPLAPLGYKAGLLLFLAATGALFVTGLRALAGGGWRTAAMAAPLVAFNAWTVQNGFLTAGLLLWCLALRERRPLLAGLCLGLASVKPQLVPLVGLLLLAEGRWRVILAGGAAAVSLAGMSLLAFGVAAWSGYLHTIVPYQKMVMMQLGGTFLTMLPAPFGALRLSGVGGGPALMLHLVVAVPVLLAVLVALWRRVPEREALVLSATFLVVPYTLSYDLGLLAGACALLARRLQPVAGAAWLLAAAALLPILMWIVGHIFLVSFAPFVLLGVAGLALRGQAAARASAVASASEVPSRMRAVSSRTTSIARRIAQPASSTQSSQRR